MLDKGDSSGEDTPQGYCSIGFGVNSSAADGSVNKLRFAFGDGSVRSCIKLNSDGQGFVLSPPDPCDPALTCNIISHWYIGASSDSATPIIVAFFQSNPAESNPPDPDKSGVMLVWRFSPPDPCKGSAKLSQPGRCPSLHHQLRADRPARTRQAGSEHQLGTEQSARTRQAGGEHQLGTERSADPDKPGASINFGLTNPPDPDKPGASINFGLTDPPYPDFRASASTAPEQLCVHRGRVRASGSLVTSL